MDMDKRLMICPSAGLPLHLTLRDLLLSIGLMNSNIHRFKALDFALIAAIDLSVSKKQ